MLSNITWTEFFTGISLLAAIYYLYVAIKYYPEKLKGLFAGRRPIDKGTSPFLQNGEAETATNAVPHEEPETGHSDLDDVEETVTELVALIQESSEKQEPADEFRKALGMALRRRPILKTSPYRPSINELVVSECGKHGTFALNEKEVDFLWEE